MSVGRRSAAVVIVAAILLLLTFGLTRSLAAAPTTVPTPSPIQLRVSGEPFAIAIDAQGARAYVTDSRDNCLYVFDMTSGEMLAAIPTGRQPNHVVLSGTRAYVSNFTDASITVIDISTNRPLKTLSVGGLGLTINRQTNHLYAAAGNRIFVLDTATERLVTTISVPAGANVWGLAVDPVAGRLYATDIANPRVLVYDGATNRLAAEIAIDAPARFGIAVGPSGTAFVASYTEKNAQLFVIDGPSARVTGRAPIGAFVNSMLVHPTSGTVYLSSRGDATVAAIDPSALGTSSSVKVAQRPAGLTIVPTSGELVLVTAGGAVPRIRPSAEPVPVVAP